MSARLTRRRALAIGAVATIGVPAVLFGVTHSSADTSSTRAGSETSRLVARKTAIITRKDLSQTVDVNGTVGYGRRRVVRGGGSGTITTLPAPGSAIAANQPLYGVDGKPGPIVLAGELPMWRTLQVGVADGPDVAQIETNLAALGFVDPALTVDDTFTALTAAAIRAWQRSIGLPDTGRIQLVVATPFLGRCRWDGLQDG